jgi:FkbM family methyltransferase
MPTCRLPDGARVSAANRMECRFLYQEIFVDRIYEIAGIPSGGCIVDAGANIGLFGLWASRHLEPSRMLHFEPIPETFALLDANAARHFRTAERFNAGLANRSGTTAFRYYPRAAGWASMATREELLRESLFAYLQRGSLGLPLAAFQFLGKLSPRLQRAIHDRVCDRIFASGRDLQCEVFSLSDVIDTNGLDRIDLLKLDVEGAELEILEGVRDEHWPQIRAITAEVEDGNGNLEAVTGLLRDRGFRVDVRQARELDRTPFFMLTAGRSR